MLSFFRKIRQTLLSQNRTSKYLLYAAGEILLVVIGILIALQINNWNEARKERIQENSYLNRILSENKQDIETFSASIKNLEKGMETVENFSRALKNKGVHDSILIFTANEYFRYGSIYPIFSSSTSTFDDLSSTGNLKVIRNSALRDQIVKHYAKHKAVAERIQIDIEWALLLDAPFSYENNILAFEPMTAHLFPDRSNADLAQELKARKIIYISNAATHYWINKDVIERLEILKEETSNLIQSIETELKINRYD